MKKILLIISLFLPMCLLAHSFDDIHFHQEQFYFVGLIIMTLIFLKIVRS